MNALVHIALFGWIPVVLLLFTVLSPRRAVVVVSIAAWLFLPVAAFPLPGLPDYTKASATTAGLLLSSVLFDPGRLTGLRPRWFDLPMLAWCLTPFASSVLNGLGSYDGLSAALAQIITWGLPYLIGRAYFGDAEGLRELAMGVVVGGLLYIPLCLFEVRMSPQLHRIVYGYHQHSFAQTVRLGGYRPMVFMAHGLAVGMWMTAAALTAYWLWATGALRRLWNLPLGRAVLPALLITAFLCKSTGALTLLAVGIVALWVAGRTGSRLPVCCLVLAAPLYMATRVAGTWSGRDLVGYAEAWFGTERAGSLEFRQRNEDILIEKALQRPAFGWGGWGQARVYNEEGRDLTVTDGLWVIALGNHGLVGLGAVSAAVLLPVVLLLRRPARSWRNPMVAPAAALAVLLTLYMIDNLANAMINPIYLIATGGLTVFGSRRAMGNGTEDLDLSELDAGRIDADGVDSLDDLIPLAIPSGLPPADPDRRHALASEHDARARSLKDLGRPSQAEAAWSVALDLWADLASEFPEYRRHRLNALNDLAWFLANDCDPDFRNPARAVRLAEEAVAGAPEDGIYWNTLGAACYRAGDWDAAIGALERSVRLASGGTGFDHLFLAMAHWRLGEGEVARFWLVRADGWMAGHAAGQPELLRLRAEAMTLMDF